MIEENPDVLLSMQVIGELISYGQIFLYTIPVPGFNFNFLDLFMTYFIIKFVLQHIYDYLSVARYEKYLDDSIYSNGSDEYKAEQKRLNNIRKDAYGRRLGRNGRGNKRRW